MTSSDQQSKSGGWPDRIHRLFRQHHVRQVAYVPDAGHARLIELAHADRAMRAIPLTTEEEGVALLAGAWLGGERGALLMLVTMRGQWGEFNPWQVPMGQATPAALASIGVVVHEVDDAARVEETVAAAARLTFGSYSAVAVLISQRIIGAKVWI